MYRSGGLAFECAKLLQDIIFDHGYLGGCGRTAITSRAAAPTRLAKYVYTGVLPNDIFAANIGWVDDLVLRFVADQDRDEHDRRKKVVCTQIT